MWMEGQPEEDDDLETMVDKAADPDSANSQGCLLPIGFVSILLVGLACLLLVHRQCVSDFFGTLSAMIFTSVTTCIFVVTLGFLALTSLCDPGQLPLAEREWPKRSHKNFQYRRPLMRFDHYCRWVNNGIALRNHRQFLVMLIGLVAIVILGIAVDVTLVVMCLSDVKLHLTFSIVVALHLVYSLALGYYVIPIFRLHVMFISRNELANEWKNDEFYIVTKGRLAGEPVQVDKLNQQEYDELFDSFQYKAELNPWDQGCPFNCWMFWCNPRSKGEF